MQEGVNTDSGTAYTLIICKRLKSPQSVDDLRILRSVRKTM